MYPVNDKGLLVYSRELSNLMDLVQRRGNKEVTYQTDRQTYGVLEKWAYPKEFDGRFFGDCEDIALYKRKLLLDAGVPSGPLLMTICKDYNQNGHCVLCVCTEDKDFIMCNNHETIVYPKIMIREDYKFLYRQGLNRKIDEPWDVLK